MHSGITLLVKLTYMPHNKCIFTHLHTCILDGQLCRFNSLHLPNASRPFLFTLAHFVSFKGWLSVDADQAPFYSSWKSSSREQEIKRNAKDIDKRRSERERKMWEMETGERGEQSACEREQEWERRCEGDVCKCVRVEERGARESDI